MSLRVKLLLLFTVAIAAAVGFTAWSAERYAARQFRQADQQRSDALVAQFRRELSEREAEVTTSVQTIADAESTVRMVLDLSRPGSDPSVYAGDARGLAASHQLDFLELAGADGTLISSAQWPDHVGYKNDWVTRQADWNQRGAFLDRIELPDRVELALITVRAVHGGNLNLYIIGGERLNSTFLETLSLPAGMRALLYRNLDAAFVPAALTDAEGPVSGAETFAPLIESLQAQPSPSGGTLEWTPDASAAQRFVALPLTGRKGELLGALLLGTAQDERIALNNYIGGSALAVAAVGLLLALLLSWWIAAGISRPLARLSDGIGEVTSGDWDAQVEAGGVREVSQTIAAFNKMTRQLIDERAGQVARERAAAWRQLAGQLAAELKTLLPPLQKAFEGLARQPDHSLDVEGEFADDVALGSDSAPDARGDSNHSAENDRLQPVSSAMRQTLETLAACAGKLGEFAALPVPRLEAVSLNDAVRLAVQSFEPRFSAIGRPPIIPELFLDERLRPVRADAVLLRRAFDNLLLFVLEDMPTGGTFSIHTRREGEMAHMILSGSGCGIAPRGESRTAAPDRTARVSGIGLSLATVQSIVSSHGGKISIESAPLAGTTFYLDWPFHNASAQSRVPALPSVLQDQKDSKLDRQEKRPAAEAAEPATRNAAESIATATPALGEMEQQPSSEAKPANSAIEEQKKPESLVAELKEERPQLKEALEEASQEASREAPAEYAAAASDQTAAPLETSLEPATEPLPLCSLASAEPLHPLEPSAIDDLPPSAEIRAEASESGPEAIAEDAPEIEAQPVAQEPQREATEIPPVTSETQPEVSTAEVATAEAVPAPAFDLQLQPVAVAVAAAQDTTCAAGARELDAVIEEVIEMRPRSYRAVDSFLSEPEYEDDSEELPVGWASQIETPVPASASSQLFGVRMPATEPEDPPSASLAPAQGESRSQQSEAPPAEQPNVTEAAASSGLEPSPAASPSNAPEDAQHKDHDDGEADPPLTYSPLTYRW